MVARRRDPLTILILAAGMGTRMRSGLVKVLHPVAGRPMIEHVLETCRALRPLQILTVIGHQADQVRETAGDLSDRFIVQKEQKGTGHAVKQAAPKLKMQGKGHLLIVNGDLPTLRPSTLRALLSRHRRSEAALTVLTARLDNPEGYGRIVRDSRGVFHRIVEDRDAGPDERAIRECNCGIYCADPARFLPVLRKLQPNNVQGEYYLTDAVHKLLEAGDKVIAVSHNDAEEVLGVNTREELARASRNLYERKAVQLQASGVTMLDASRTWVDSRAKIGRDSVLYPDVIIEGPCTLGEGCTVRSGSRIVDSRLGKQVEVLDHSVILESRVGAGAKIGPFAHVRPHSRLDARVKVGNFVEVKKSRLREGVKASHLTYLGDADIGENSNIGAGTITCNYDGENKLPTVLGKNVFVGSDTQFVAPVEIGDDAYIAAGTTVTEDVPGGDLAISRTRQTNKKDWVKRHKARKSASGTGKKGGK